MVVAGYTVFGVTGFGASPLTIPLLVHVLPLTFVLPLAALLDLGSALALGLHTRREAHGRELLTLMPFTIVGLLLGVTVLVRLRRRGTVLALGLFVCAYALYVVFRRDTARRLTRRWAAVAGTAGGVLAPCSAWAAPRMSCTSRGASPTRRRSARRSPRWSSSTSDCASSPSPWADCSPRPAVGRRGDLLPLAWMGVWIGQRIHVGLAPAAVARIIGAALFGAGGALFVRTF